MVDLEKLAQTCREKNRWTFFVTSAPANVPGKLSYAVPESDTAKVDTFSGGVATHVNGTAIF